MRAHRQHFTPAPQPRPATEQAAGVVLAFVISLLIVLAGLHGLGALFF